MVKANKRTAVWRPYLPRIHPNRYRSRRPEVRKYGIQDATHILALIGIGHFSTPDISQNNWSSTNSNPSHHPSNTSGLSTPQYSTDPEFFTALINHCSQMAALPKQSNTSSPPTPRNLVTTPSISLLPSSSCKYIDSPSNTIIVGRSAGISPIYATKFVAGPSMSVYSLPCTSGSGNRLLRNSATSPRSTSYHLTPSPHLTRSHLASSPHAR